jgi:hypothetical protein
VFNQEPSALAIPWHLGRQGSPVALIGWRLLRPPIGIGTRESPDEGTTRRTARARREAFASLPAPLGDLGSATTSCTLFELSLISVGGARFSLASSLVRGSTEKSSQSGLGDVARLVRQPPAMVILESYRICVSAVACRTSRDVSEGPDD